MRVIVCLKEGLPARSLPTRGTADRRFAPHGSLPDRLATILQPIGRHDESALEAALRYRNSAGGELLAVTVGPDNDATDRTLRTALAAGADDALKVVSDSADEFDSSMTASVLAAALRDAGTSGPVFFGARGSVWESGTTPQLVAYQLSARFCRSGSVPAEVRQPLVLSVQRSPNLRIRVPSIQMINDAYDRPIRRVAVSELGIDDLAPLVVSGVLTARAVAAEPAVLRSDDLAELAAEVAERLLCLRSAVSGSIGAGGVR